MKERTDGGGKPLVQHSAREAPDTNTNLAGVRCHRYSTNSKTTFMAFEAGTMIRCDSIFTFGICATCRTLAACESEAVRMRSPAMSSVRPAGSGVAFPN